MKHIRALSKTLKPGTCSCFIRKNRLSKKAHCPRLATHFIRNQKDRLVPICDRCSVSFFRALKGLNEPRWVVTKVSFPEGMAEFAKQPELPNIKKYG